MVVGVQTMQQAVEFVFSESRCGELHFFAQKPVWEHKKFDGKLTIQNCLEKITYTCKQIVQNLLGLGGEENAGLAALSQVSQLKGASCL